MQLYQARKKITDTHTFRSLYGVFVAKASILVNNENTEIIQILNFVATLKTNHRKIGRKAKTALETLLKLIRNNTDPVPT
ncbi:hypothetical protein VTN96DRAFT_9219 [Rasamsonia emersonii]